MLARRAGRGQAEKFTPRSYANTAASYSGDSVGLASLVKSLLAELYARITDCNRRSLNHADSLAAKLFVMR